MFAAYLPYHKDGAFDFGATDASRYTGDILYTPVDDPEGLWKFPSSAYKVDGVDHPSPGVFGMAGMFFYALFYYYSYFLNVRTH